MAIPKYQQMQQNLLYEIKSGLFQPGDKFYSEAELKKKYNVSGITAIKALQGLTIEGYLVRIRARALMCPRRGRASR